MTGHDVIRPGLIKRIMVAENVVAAFRARAGAENWATFGNNNPGLAALLVEAERCANANE